MPMGAHLARMRVIDAYSPLASLEAKGGALGSVSCGAEEDGLRRLHHFILRMLTHIDRLRRWVVEVGGRYGLEER